MSLSKEDFTYIKEMKLTKQHFSWTYYSILRFNIIIIVTMTVVGFSKNKSIMEMLSATPLALFMMTAVCLVIFPFVDIWEFLSDKAMCRRIDWCYEKDFLHGVAEKEKDKMRASFKKLTERNCEITEMKKILSLFKF